MTCGASLRQSCPGRCQRCMMGKSHSGMTTNGVKCLEGVGQSAALGGLGDEQRKWLIYDLVEQIQKRNGNERQTTWIRCLFRLLGAAQIHERTEQHANLICFVDKKIVRTARAAPVASPQVTRLLCATRTNTQYSHGAQYVQYTQDAQHASTTDTRHRTPDTHTAHCIRQLLESAQRTPHLNDTPCDHHVFFCCTNFFNPYYKTPCVVEASVVNKAGPSTCVVTHIRCKKFRHRIPYKAFSCANRGQNVELKTARCPLHPRQLQ